MGSLPCAWKNWMSSRKAWPSAVKNGWPVKRAKSIWTSVLPPWTRNSAYRRAFLKHLEDQGLSEADANAALNGPWEDTPLDRVAVKARIGEWLEEQLGQSPSAKPVRVRENDATDLATETAPEAAPAEAAEPQPSAVEAL